MLSRFAELETRLSAKVRGYPSTVHFELNPTAPVFVPQQNQSVDYQSLFEIKSMECEDLLARLAVLERLVGDLSHTSTECPTCPSSLASAACPTSSLTSTGSSSSTCPSSLGSSLASGVHCPSWRCCCRACLLAPGLLYEPKQEPRFGNEDMFATGEPQGDPGGAWQPADRGEDGGRLAAATAEPEKQAGAGAVEEGDVGGRGLPEGPAAIAVAAYGRAEHAPEDNADAEPTGSHDEVYLELQELSAEAESNAARWYELQLVQKALDGWAVVCGYRSP